MLNPKFLFIINEKTNEFLPWYTFLFRNSSQRSRGHSRPTFSSDEIVRVNDDPLLSHSCNPSIRKVDKATRKLFPALHTSFRRRTALRTIARIPGLQTSLFHSRPRLSKCVTNRSVHTANSFTPYQDHSQPPPDPPWP